ncbi:MAG: hypothetical protein MZV70_46610 [Desulfobacterales bacterium]|nr:hypothetical protein [Desulfobacterales bacterium]
MRFLLQRRKVNLASALFVSLIFALMPTVAWLGNSSVAVVSVTVFQAIPIVMAGLLLRGRATAALRLPDRPGQWSLHLCHRDGWALHPDPSRDPISIWFMQIILSSAIATMLYLNRLIRESFARAHHENEEHRAAEAPCVTPF